MILILLLLFVFLITALAIPQKVLGFIKTSNGIRRLIAVLIFLSVIGGFFFYAMWSWNQYQNEREEQLAAIPIEQYADSIMKAYPNFAGNDAVMETICEDFEKRLEVIPGILEDEPFYMVGGIHEVAGRYYLMLASEGVASVRVWDENLAKKTAVKLDKKKMYKITGGKFDRYEPSGLSLTHSLSLGTIYINDIELEEIPGLEPSITVL